MLEQEIESLQGHEEWLQALNEANKNSNESSLDKAELILYKIIQEERMEEHVLPLLE